MQSLLGGLQTAVHSVFSAVNRVDLGLYHFLDSFAGNRFLDRFVAFQETMVFFKGGVFLALYWYLWFKNDSRQQERRRVIVAVILGTAAVIMLAHGLSGVVPFRTRPVFDSHLEHHLSLPNPTTLFQLNSFPSDTVAYLCALAFGLIYLCRSRTVSALIAAYTFFWICVPRLYLGLHYLSDVVAGGLIGILMIWAVLKVNFQESRIITRMVRFVDSQPGLFYGMAFLVTLEMAEIFWDIRSAEHRLRHASAMLHLNKLVLTEASLCIAFLATTVALIIHYRSSAVRREHAAVAQLVKMPVAFARRHAARH